MKRFILYSTLAIVLVACNASADTTGKDNVTLVENYIKAVEAMDYEAMGNFLDDKYMGNGPSYGDTIYKTQAIANWKDNVANLYESIKYNRSKCAPLVIAEGDNQGNWVVNWAELNIKYKNDGGQVNIWAVTSYHVENGKILKTITVYNELDALRQLGYNMVPADQ